VPISRYGVNLSLFLHCQRSATSHGITLRYYDVLESVAYEEGFPVISRFVRQDHS
jgi:hypothetical protein